MSLSVPLCRYDKAMALQATRNMKMNFDDLIYGNNYEQGGANTMIVYLANAYARPDKIYHTNMAGLEDEANRDGEIYHAIYNDEDEETGEFYLDGETKTGDFSDEEKISAFFGKIRDNYQTAYLISSQADLDRLSEVNPDVFNRIVGHFYNE